MATVNNIDYSQKQGKLNKKDNVIHRVRNGKEHVYSIVDPYRGPASKAQNDHRKLFGKVNSIVNIIMADPQQKTKWTARKEEHNQSVAPYKPPFAKRFKTTRQYVFAVVSDQLKRQSAAKSRKSTENLLLPKGVTLHIDSFADLSAADMYEILKARYAVFTMEQGIIYLDEDNVDYLATHLSLRRNGLVIAYARLFPDAEPGVLRIGRMFTVERGKGFGKYLMTQIIDEAKRQDANKLRMHAQTQAVPFYEHFGFKPIGDIFIEAGISHIMMELHL